MPDSLLSAYIMLLTVDAVAVASVLMRRPLTLF
jgi:hypothetical protein